jgi:hypothetical protein
MSTVTDRILEALGSLADEYCRAYSDYNKKPELHNRERAYYDAESDGLERALDVVRGIIDEEEDRKCDTCGKPYDPYPEQGFCQSCNDDILLLAHACHECKAYHETAHANRNGETSCIDAQ